MWKKFYPKEGLDENIINILEEIENGIDPFVDLVINHSTKEMQGRKLIQLFSPEERSPDHLRQLYQLWKTKKINLGSMKPTMVLAVLGQAKYDLVIDAADESKILTKQLRQWAFNRN